MGRRELVAAAAAFSGLGIVAVILTELERRCRRSGEGGDDVTSAPSRPRESSAARGSAPESRPSDEAPRASAASVAGGVSGGSGSTTSNGAMCSYNGLAGLSQNLACLLPNGNTGSMANNGSGVADVTHSLAGADLSRQQLLESLAMQSSSSKQPLPFWTSRGAAWDSLRYAPGADSQRFLASSVGASSSYAELAELPAGGSPGAGALGAGSRADPMQKVRLDQLFRYLDARHGEDPHQSQQRQRLQRKLLQRSGGRATEVDNAPSSPTRAIEADDVQDRLQDSRQMEELLRELGESPTTPKGRRRPKAKRSGARASPQSESRGTRRSREQSLGLTSPLAGTSPQRSPEASPEVSPKEALPAKSLWPRDDSPKMPAHAVAPQAEKDVAPMPEKAATEKSATPKPEKAERAGAQMPEKASTPKPEKAPMPKAEKAEKVAMPRAEKPVETVPEAAPKELAYHDGEMAPDSDGTSEAPSPHAGMQKKEVKGAALAESIRRVLAGGPPPEPPPEPPEPSPEPPPTEPEGPLLTAGSYNSGDFEEWLPGDASHGVQGFQVVANRKSRRKRGHREQNGAGNGGASGGREDAKNSTNGAGSFEEEVSVPEAPARCTVPEAGAARGVNEVDDIGTNTGGTVVATHSDCSLQETASPAVEEAAGVALTSAVGLRVDERGDKENAAGAEPEHAAAEELAFAAHSSAVSPDVATCSENMAADRELEELEKEGTSAEVLLPSQPSTPATFSVDSVASVTDSAHGSSSLTDSAAADLAVTEARSEVAEVRREAEDVEAQSQPAAQPCVDSAGHSCSSDGNACNCTFRADADAVDGGVQAGSGLDAVAQDDERKYTAGRIFNTPSRRRTLAENASSRRRKQLWADMSDDEEDFPSMQELMEYSNPVSNACDAVA